MIMKKLVTMLVLILYFIQVINVYASNSTDSELYYLLNNLNIVDEDFFVSKTITREEALISIMRVIGATDEKIEESSGADLIAFADTETYSYFGCAWLCGIAYGEECVVDYPTDRTSHTLKNTDFFFFPERAVTIKECLAFMIRCLQSDKTDFDLTLEKAKDIGLINDKDNFIRDPNSIIGQDDFFVLLGRMLQQKRYKYFAEENNRIYMCGNIDTEKSMTYLEFLTQRRQVQLVQLERQGDGLR